MQYLDQNGIEIDVANLASSNKGNIIRVLHVDDDLAMVEISKQILMDLNSCFEFDGACCVDEAFKKLSTGQYDIVISDYELPQKDGLKFLKELRERKNEIPFILFTGKGREEVVIQALNLGADHYVNKHGSPETVYSELEHLVSSAVEKSRAKLKNKNDSLALHNVHDAIVSSDANFIITAWNKVAEELFGFDSKEVLGKKIDDVFQKIQVTPKHEELIRQLKITGQFQGEIVYQNKKGEKRDGELQFISILSENGKLFGNVAVCHDITERKKAEEALIVSEKNYRNLINSMGESVWVGNFEGKFVEVNNAAIEMLGYGREELLSLGIKGIDNYMTPEELKNVTSRVVSGKTQVFETIHTSKDGREIPVEISSSLITYQEKPAILAIARNIAERKKTEESLRKSEEENNSLFANTSDGFAYCQMIFDDQQEPVDFVYLQINDAFETITGLKRGLVVGKKVTQAIPGIKEANPELFEIYGRVALTGKKEKIDLFFKPLSMWLSISVYCPRKGYFAALFEDITQRKKIEDSLKESEEKFRNLAEESPNMIFMNKQGRVLYANKKCEDITGYTREELYSPNFNFLSLCSPEYVEVMTSFAKHMKGEDAPSYDYVLITKSGERVDVMTTSKLINYNGEKAILGIVTDISELKKAQETLNKTMDELVSVNEKLGVVGSLTRHDVRNKLSAINGYTYLLKKKHENQADIVEGLNKIEQSVKDSVKIFEFAKMYEQLGVEELICVDVGNAVDEALALFSGLTIKIQNDCHGIKMLADSFRRQMFYNFIDNTRKYGVKATTINVYYQEEESGKLSLVYEDDGVGISAENKPRLFAEGFSTGSSTGFGLFLIKKMIDVYGWSIIEEGESGKGAKFSITIPTQQLVHS